MSSLTSPSGLVDASLECGCRATRFVLRRLMMKASEWLVLDDLSRLQDLLQRNEFSEAAQRLLSMTGEEGVQLKEHDRDFLVASAGVRLTGAPDRADETITPLPPRFRVERPDTRQPDGAGAETDDTVKTVMSRVEGVTVLRMGSRIDSATNKVLGRVYLADFADHFEEERIIDAVVRCRTRTAEEVLPTFIDGRRETEVLPRYHQGFLTRGRVLWRRGAKEHALL
jgi:hypothetical protein